MLDLREIYSKYLKILVMSTVITVSYALIGFSPQAVQDLLNGKGGGDELVMVIALTGVFFISLILIFMIYIMKAKVDLRSKITFAASFIFSFVVTLILAGIIWASLIAVIGGSALLASILLSPWLAYFITKKRLS